MCSSAPRCGPGVRRLRIVQQRYSKDGGGPLRSCMVTVGMYLVSAPGMNRHSILRHAIGRYRVVRLLVMVVLASCGSDQGAEPPVCTGTSCACTAANCDFTDSACGNQTSCSLSCKDQSTCTGTCGESCSIDCAAMSTCTVTVGASGSVSCGAGSTCHVTCTDSCSVSCSGATSCDLLCKGDTKPLEIPQGGQCSP